jgi:TPR repeat protein
MTRQMMFILNPPELAWFFRQREAAEAGDGAAACRLGDCYRTGKPLPPVNPRKAFRWYLRGSWAGDDSAMNNLGACYHNGFGCTKDMAQAIHWYQRGAEAGSDEALDNLGRCYKEGNGVPQDLERAAGYFREALAKGHPKAAERLTEMGLAVDPAGALACIVPTLGIIMP